MSFCIPQDLSFNFLSLNIKILIIIIFLYYNSINHQVFIHHLKNNPNSFLYRIIYISTVKDYYIIAYTNNKHDINNLWQYIVKNFPELLHNLQLKNELKDRYILAHFTTLNNIKINDIQHYKSKKKEIKEHSNDNNNKVITTTKVNYPTYYINYQNIIFILLILIILTTLLRDMSNHIFNLTLITFVIMILIILYEINIKITFENKNKYLLFYFFFFFLFIETLK